MSNLPYITAPGNIEKTLNAIKSAATPAKVSQDFVKTILGIKGGSGDQITSFLKKIGFASTDGSPTAIYKKFRNPSTAGSAVAEAIKYAYSPLYNRNEYMHNLSEKDLKGIIIEETGLEEESNVVTMILSAIKSLKKFASWDAEDTTKNDNQDIDLRQVKVNDLPAIQSNIETKKLNISYTINLNLPASSDPAVFNAIFKSLKENILKE